MNIPDELIRIAEECDRRGLFAIANEIDEIVIEEIDKKNMKRRFAQVEGPDPFADTFDPEPDRYQETRDFLDSLSPEELEFFLETGMTFEEAKQQQASENAAEEGSGDWVSGFRHLGDEEDLPGLESFEEGMDRAYRRSSRIDSSMNRFAQKQRYEIGDIDLPGLSAEEGMDRFPGFIDIGGDLGDVVARGISTSEDGVTLHGVSLISSLPNLDPNEQLEIAQEAIYRAFESAGEDIFRPAKEKPVAPDSFMDATPEWQRSSRIDSSMNRFAKTRECPSCGGPAKFSEPIGGKIYSRCRNCGQDWFSEPRDEADEIGDDELQAASDILESLESGKLYEGKEFCPECDMMLKEWDGKKYCPHCEIMKDPAPRISMNMGGLPEGYLKTSSKRSNLSLQQKRAILERMM